MGFYFPLEGVPVFRHRAFTHDGLADDERGLAGFGHRRPEGPSDSFLVVPFNSLYMPSPGFVFLCGIFIHYGRYLGRQLNVVGIIKHHDIAQAQKAGGAAGALGNLFLYASVGDIEKGFVFGNLPEAGRQKTFGNGASDAEGVPLPQRAGGVLHPSGDIPLRVAGGDTAPLPEIHQVFGAVMAEEMQDGIKHGRHVAGVLEKPVPKRPLRVLRVEIHKL